MFVLCTTLDLPRPLHTNQGCLFHNTLNDSELQQSENTIYNLKLKPIITSIKYIIINKKFNTKST